MKKSNRQPVFSTTLLIGGAAVGAGILGLPVQTGPAGFVPAAFGLLLMALAMLAVAWVMAWGLIKNQERQWDLPKLMEHNLGARGKWAMTVGYLINYYGLLVAYLAGAASLLTGMDGAGESRIIWMLVFFVPVTGLTLLGLNRVRLGNAVFMAILGLSFVVLVYGCLGQVKLDRLVRTDWPYFPAALPLIMTSLVYHTIVPAACRSLDYQPRPVFISLALGTAIPLVFCLIWLVVVIGALPLEEGGQCCLLYALNHDEPATLPLAQGLGSSLVTSAGLTFSICAIFTSYLAAGTGLLGFWRDLLPPRLHKKTFRALITFLPPLAVALIWPDLFLSALNLAGGLGVAVAFGAVPALALMATPGLKPAIRWGGGLILLALFLGIMIAEICTEAGLMQIEPTVEHWTNYQH